MNKLFIILLLITSRIFAHGGIPIISFDYDSDNYISFGANYNQARFEIGKQTEISVMGLEMSWLNNERVSLGTAFGLGYSDGSRFNLFLKPHIGVGYSIDKDVFGFYLGGTGEFFTKLTDNLSIFTEAGAFLDPDSSSNWMLVFGLRYNFGFKESRY